jgi:cyclic pyranopterin phosphate synthase
MELRDQLGRKINYLRLSVTDRCNLRCIYCMPKEGIEFTAYDKVLRLEELAGLAARFINLFEIDKIRLTGGEPLVRKNLEVLVEILSAIPELKDLALTTNGTHLAAKAKILLSAGLRRINVSLDSLNEDRYRKITGGGNLGDVLKGLEAAKDAGLAPIKINTVLLPDFDEEFELIEWSNRNGHILRFIELMPHSSENSGRSEQGGATEAEILARLETKVGGIEKIESHETRPGNHSSRYMVPERDWIFEVIPSVSAPFCDNCNRIRLDCQGILRPCLYSSSTIQLRDYLHLPDEEFIKVVEKFVGRKTGRAFKHIGSDMSSIGG